MKNANLLTALLVALTGCSLFAQKDEGAAPPEYFSVNDPALEKWEAWFENTLNLYGLFVRIRTHSFRFGRFL